MIRGGAVSGDRKAPPKNMAVAIRASHANAVIRCQRAKPGWNVSKAVGDGIDQHAEPQSQAAGSVVSNAGCLCGASAQIFFVSEGPRLKVEPFRSGLTGFVMAALGGALQAEAASRDVAASRALMRTVDFSRVSLDSDFLVGALELSERRHQAVQTPLQSLSDRRVIPVVDAGPGQVRCDRCGGLIQRLGQQDRKLRHHLVKRCIALLLRLIAVLGGLSVSFIGVPQISAGFALRGKGQARRTKRQVVHDGDLLSRKT